MTDISITESIPHRDAMLLVDQVLTCSESEIVCSKTFRGDEFFFQGHYPDHPIVPGVILCECAAQSAAILLANGHIDADDSMGKVPVLTRMNKVRFKNTVHPGDVIEIKVRLDEQISGAYFLSASIRNHGKLAASLELACTLAVQPTIQNVDSDNSAKLRQPPPAPKSTSQHKQNSPATKTVE